MGSFRRAFLGYRRAKVDAAMASRDACIQQLERETYLLAEMVVAREREIQTLHEALDEANERHERSVNALQTVAMRVEEIQAQARGQATRIRMKALRDAIEISRQVKEVANRVAAEPPASNGSDPLAREGRGERSAANLFEGLVEVEIGPLGDFSQLVGFEDAAGQIDGTSEISLRRFSEGRATLSMRLDEPVELLRELEEHSPLEFRVRKTGQGRVVLDCDDDQAQAA